MALPRGFFAKLERAKEHLNTLQRSVDSTIKYGDLYTIRREANFEEGLFSFYVQVNTPADLEYWSVIVGDCIHNCRSALDHLFWGLILERHPTGPDGNMSTAQFPILKDSGTFHGRVSKFENWLDVQAFAYIQSLQPFNQASGPEDSVLWMLHDLDIRDKHRLLLPTVAVTQAVNLNVQAVEGKQVTTDGFMMINLEELEDGAKVGDFTLRPARDVVDVNLDLTLHVIMKIDERRFPLVPLLLQIISFVESVGHESKVLFR